MTFTPRQLTGRSTARGSALLTITGFIQMGIGLVSMVILTRALGVSGYGVYIVLRSVYEAACAGFQLGAGQVVIADVSREIGKGRFDRCKRLLLDFSWTQIVLSLVLSLVLAGATLAVRPIVTTRFGEDVTQGLFLVSLWLLITGVKNIVRVGLTTHGAFGALVFWSVAESLLRFGGILVFVVGFDSGIPGVLLADIAALCVALLLVAVPLLRSVSYLRGRERFREWLLPGVLRAHGKWSVFLTAGTHASAGWKTWILAFLIDAEAVAIYEIAKRLVVPAKVLLPLKTVLSPLLSRHIGDPARIQHLVHMSLRYRFLLSVFATLIGSIIAYPVFAVLFPDIYPEGVLIFQILLFRLVVRAPSDVLNPFFSATQMQRYSFYTFLLGELTLVGVGIPLIYLFGLVGAAVEAVFATMLVAIVGYRLAVSMDPGLKISPRMLLRLNREDWTLAKDVLLFWRQRRAHQDVSALSTEK